MIIRKKYIDEIMPFADSDLVKVITGIRRCGKSVVLEEIKDLISNKSNNIVYLDFDNRAATSFIKDWQDIVNHVKENRKSGICYVFLDEVQNIDCWSDAVRSLRRENCSVFITGSNSKLLSSEITKEIAGRFVSFRIRPFVFREALEYSKQLGKDFNIQDYLIWGAFPQGLEQKTVGDLKNYLYSLNETIVINDIILRYKIKRVEDFKKVVDFILLSNSRIYSAHSISNYMKSNSHIEISANTIQKWLGFLKGAYIIDEIPRFSKRAKRQLENSKKIYNCDVSFNSLRQRDGEWDITHNLENIIYNELLYQGYTLEVYSDADSEIDFIATKNEKRFYIQVAYSIIEKRTREREFKPFAKLDNLHKKIIVTADEYDYSTSTIQHIKLKDFLRMKDFESI